MENKTAKTVRIVPGLNANPQVYLNQERGSITHRLGSDLKIEMLRLLERSLMVSLLDP